jgi:hypothetical protein
LSYRELDSIKIIKIDFEASTKSENKIMNVVNDVSYQFAKSQLEIPRLLGCTRLMKVFEQIFQLPKCFELIFCALVDHRLSL